MIKYVFALILVACLSNISQAQKITYSSTQKYQNVRLVVKYPTLTKKAETNDSDKVALVQTPFVTTKRVIYGAVVSDRK